MAVKLLLLLPTSRFSYSCVRENSFVYRTQCSQHSSPRFSLMFSLIYPYAILYIATSCEVFIMNWNISGINNSCHRRSVIEILRTSVARLLNTGCISIMHRSCKWSLRNFARLVNIFFRKKHMKLRFEGKHVSYVKWYDTGVNSFETWLVARSLWECCYSVIAIYENGRSEVINPSRIAESSRLYYWWLWNMYHRLFQ
jgi:hypothetical protein